MKYNQKVIKFRKSNIFFKEIAQEVCYKNIKAVEKDYHDKMDMMYNRVQELETEKIKLERKIGDFLRDIHEKNKDRANKE